MHDSYNRMKKKITYDLISFHAMFDKCEKSLYSMMNISKQKVISNRVISKILLSQYPHIQK